MRDPIKETQDQQVDEKTGKCSWDETVYFDQLNVYSAYPGNKGHLGTHFSSSYGSCEKFRYLCGWYGRVGITRLIITTDLCLQLKFKCEYDVTLAETWAISKLFPYKVTVTSMI